MEWTVYGSVVLHLHGGKMHRNGFLLLSNFWIPE